VRSARTQPRFLSCFASAYVRERRAFPANGIGARTLRYPQRGEKWDAATRKPLLMLSLCGLFLLRNAQRAFDSLLLNDPPRNTALTGWPRHQ